MNSWVSKTRKPEVSSPKIPTGFGNSCDVGLGEERLEVWESVIEEGSECENLQRPKTLKLKHQSSEIPKFSKDIRTVVDLTVGSSWTKTPKIEVPKSQKFAKKSRAQKT
jgi:hypothetical protein